MGNTPVLPLVQHHQLQLSEDVSNLQTIFELAHYAARVIACHTRRLHLSETLLSSNRSDFLEACANFLNDCGHTDVNLSPERVKLGTHDWVPKESEGTGCFLVNIAVLCASLGAHVNKKKGPASRTVILSSLRKSHRLCWGPGFSLLLREWVAISILECVSTHSGGFRMIGEWVQKQKPARNPDQYRDWRFNGEKVTLDEEVIQDSAKNAWLQVALRIRDPFLSCYRGIHGAAGLYWLLPLLGAMHLHKRYQQTPPTAWPKVHRVDVQCCSENRDGVLLCKGVHMPCVWAPLHRAGPVEDVRVHMVSEQESEKHAMMLRYHACLQANQPCAQETPGTTVSCHGRGGE